MARPRFQARVRQHLEAKGIAGERLCLTVVADRRAPVDSLRATPRVCARAMHSIKDVWRRELRWKDWLRGAIRRNRQLSTARPHPETEPVELRRRAGVTHEEAHVIDPP